MAGVWQGREALGIAFVRSRPFGRWYFPASWCRCSISERTWYLSMDLSDLMCFSLVSCRTSNSNIFQLKRQLLELLSKSFLVLRNGLTPAARFIGPLWVDCSSQTSRIHLPRSGQCRPPAASHWRKILKHVQKGRQRKTSKKVLNAPVLIGYGSWNILD